MAPPPPALPPPAPPPDSPETWLPEDLPRSEGPADLASTGRPTPRTERGAPPPLAGRPVDDRFELLTLLGRGGMGEVWRARDLELGRVVALKILRPDLPRTLAGRFLYEARATAALDHPGIVAVHEAGRMADGRPCYVMREIRGTTLRERIREVHEASTLDAWAPSGEGWTLRRLVEAFLLACEAVAYAHARDVIHRDLKPDNVMLGDFGEVLVVDWGLVKVVGESSEEQVIPAEALPALAVTPGSGPTRPGQAAGTVGYMPPEQARGELHRLSPASDVFALGGVLSCILTGRQPGPQGPDAALLDLPRVPEGLRALVEVALDPDPARRPRDAGELGEAVRAWLDRTATLAEHQARLQAVEDAYAALPADLRERTREVLLALVDAEGAARPRAVDELDPAGLRALVEAGIVTVQEGRARAEPAVAGWTRLLAWIAADRPGQRIRHELAVAAAGWVDRGHERRDLWRGEVVQRATAWVEQRRPLLSPRERAFLRASARTASRRRAALRGALAALVLVLLASTVASTTQWRRAEDARAAEAAAVQTARARALKAEAARQRLAGDDHAAMVLETAWQDLTGKPAPEARDLAARVGGMLRLPMEGGGEVAWSADGTRLATLDVEGRLTIHEADGAVRARAEQVQAFAWAPAGHRLAWLHRDGRLVRGDDDTQTGLGTWPDHELAWPADLLLRGPQELVWLDEAGQPTRRLHAPRRPDEHLDPSGLHRTWVGEGIHVASLDDPPVELLLRVRSAWAVHGTLPDRRRLWVGDHVGGVTLYDAGGRELTRLRGTGPGVTVTTPSPDGSLLAAGGFDNLVRVIDLEDGRLVRTFEGHDRPVHAVAFHGSGRLLASGGYDDEVLVWEVDSGRVIARLAGIGGQVESLAFSPDGRVLAVATTRDLSLWSPASLPVVALPACPSLRADPQPDGRRWVLTGGDGVCTVDLLTGQRTRHPELRAAAVDAAGDLVGLRGDQVVEIDLDGARAPRTLAAARGASSLLLPPSGPPATIDTRGLLQGGTADAPWRLALVGWPGWTRHHPLDRYASWLDEGGGLVVLDLVQGRVALRVPPWQVSRINLGWALDGDRLLVGDDQGRVRAFPLDPPGEAQVLLDDAHGSPIGALAAREGLLVLGDGDGHVRILQDGALLHELSLPGTATATHLAPSPDGQRLLVGTDYAGLSVIDIPSGRALRVVDRARRGLLHSLGWLGADHVVGVGNDDAWVWEVPGAAPEPLALTNLRVCSDDMKVVAVSHPGPSPWAPPERCREG
ncbi:protein kinase [Myxococcota bacterium]|nr:protein kinase [Myxococcota bacterium]